MKSPILTRCKKLGLAGAVLLMLPTVGALPAAAETIKIPVGQQAAAKEVEKPSLGMSKTMVERYFGPPTEKVAPRGEPPISRWIYQDFVVYFEGDIVIHAVTKHRPQQ